MSDTTCNVCGGPVPAAQPAVWHKDGFDVVRCRQCGLLFRRTLPTVEELSEIYAEAYFRRPEDDPGGQGYDDYLHDEELHRRNAAMRVRRLGATCRPAGCSTSARRPGSSSTRRAAPAESSRASTSRRT